jgi:hypothetical protein
VAWGLNDWGQLNIPANLPRVTAMAAGARHTVVQLCTGKVLAWGGSSTNLAAVPPSLAGTLVIAAGAEHSLAFAPPPSPLSNQPVLFTGVSVAGGQLHLNWDGGWPRFSVEGSSQIPPLWTLISNTCSSSISIPLSGGYRFFRVLTLGDGGPSALGSWDWAQTRPRLEWRLD